MYRNIVLVFCLTIPPLFVQCDVTDGMNQVISKSISCYECNSEYDPRCGDPFDSFTIGVVNCSKKRPLGHITEKPTLCRKMVQKVKEEVRVIRGCGYIPDERDDKQCVRRSGTHEIQVIYCSCTKDLCNTGHSQIRPKFYVILGAILWAIIGRLL